MGSSLAKGFGAPLAVIAGNAKLIAKFEGSERDKSSL